MYNGEAPPPPLPPLQRTWRVKEVAPTFFRAATANTAEKWYIVCRRLAVAEAELQPNPLTYQESPWEALYGHHHIVN
jgi:hypothetical protein